MILLLGLEPVTLTPLTPPPAFGDGWVWIAFLCASSLAAGGFISWRAWRSPRADEPDERAFRALAHRLALARKHRAAARVIASRAGIPAVALLVSEGAFDTAAAASGHPLAQELRLRLFSDR